MNNKIQNSQKMEPRLEEKLNQLEILRQSLEEKKKLARENHNKFLRLAADFDNYRKRTEKEKRELIEFAEENLLLSLLPILDSFREATSEQVKKSKRRNIKIIGPSNLVCGLPYPIFTSPFSLLTFLSLVHAVPYVHDAGAI